MRWNNSSATKQPFLERSKSKRWQFRSVFQIGSIFQWTLVIFFVVTLPLILTLVYSVRSIQDYTDHSHTALFQIVRISENNESPLKHLLVMDRSIRQYQILGDAAIFAVFQSNHQEFVEIAARTSHFQIPEKI